MITIEQAKSLKQGDMLLQDGTNKKWKVTSVKTWKRDSSRVQIGLKHGLYSYAKITENDLHLVSLINY